MDDLPSPALSLLVGSRCQRVGWLRAGDSRVRLPGRDLLLLAEWPWPDYWPLCLSFPPLWNGHNHCLLLRHEDHRSHAAWPLRRCWLWLIACKIKGLREISSKLPCGDVSPWASHSSYTFCMKLRTWLHWKTHRKHAQSVNPQLVCMPFQWKALCSVSLARASRREMSRSLAPPPRLSSSSISTLFCKMGMRVPAS